MNDSVSFIFVSILLAEFLIYWYFLLLVAYYFFSLLNTYILEEF